MKILVTVSAGFIGMHLVMRLCKEGYTVTVIDNLNDYYSVQLKCDRLAHSRHPRYRFFTADIFNNSFISALLAFTVFSKLLCRIVGEHLFEAFYFPYTLTNE